MNLSIQEKIELILNFKTWYGYKKEDINDFPELVKLVSLNGAYLEDATNLYKLTEDGENILSGCIKQISEEFISFFKSKRYILTVKDMQKWFMTFYSIDEDMAKEISTYIANNLGVYGYKASYVYCSKYGNRIEFEKKDKN